MGKLIFLDVDGTIIIPKQPPSKRTVAAIRAARSNGHKVFLSTGRVENDVVGNVRAIGFDGGIYSAGGRAVLNGTEILNHPMSAELVQRVTELMDECNMLFMMESTSGTYVLKNGMLTQINVDQFYTSGEPQRIMDERKSGSCSKWMPAQKEIPVYKIEFLARSKKQVDWVSEQLDDTAKICCFDDLIPGLTLIFGEVSDWSINKGAALKSICRYLNVTPEDCIAFGDSMNDVEILQTAGLGIAMENAEPSVKEIADQICERCEEDGVAKALERLKLI